MAEYIEREAVLNDIAELFTLCHETFPNESGHHFIVEEELETHWDFVKNIPAADVVPGKDFRDCRNELCLRCGEYKMRHKGACDGCRWRDVDE